MLARITEKTVHMEIPDVRNLSLARLTKKPVSGKGMPDCKNGQGKSLTKEMILPKKHTDNKRVIAYLSKIVFNSVLIIWLKKV